MPLSDADYADVKRRLAADTLSVAVLHVRGDVDAQHLTTRAPLQVQRAAHLFSGTGVPSNVLGVNGDYYLRTDVAHIYVKASGSFAVLI